jgi:UDP-N-acetylglucosamine transferase subunit ALG13
VIFVTIGSVFPFDRLVRAADAWAGEVRRNGSDEEILAQIGHGTYEPRHMAWVRRLERDAYQDTARRARLIVAHAGMGSVITAGELGTPIVILPRRKGLGEHNTDHQVATATWLRDRPGIFVAEAEAALGSCIETALVLQGGTKTLAPHAPPDFVARIRRLILDG